MQVKVEVLEGLLRKLTVEVPQTEVSEKLSEKLKKIQKAAKFDGFRKGKVPMSLVVSKYQPSALQDVLSDMMQHSYDHAIRQEKLIPATSPQITPLSGFDGDSNFVYEAHLEVVPDFDIKGLDSLSIKKPIAKIERADIDNMIENLRKQTATWSTADADAVAGSEGDRLTVSFVGKIDGDTFEGGSADNVTFTIGNKQMLADFETAVLGKKVGNTAIATVSFPADYHGKDVAGKTAEFTIQINKLEKPVLPEVDTAFIKRFGFGDGSQEAFEAAIVENMQRELDANTRQAINKQVMQHLVDANPVTLPESMVKQEIERMAHETGLTQQVKDSGEIEKIKAEQFDQPARRRVLLGLVMGKLFDDQHIQLDVARVEARVKDIAQTYEKPEEVFAHYQKNPKALEQVYAQVMEDQLIEKLLETANIVEESKSFDDMMKKV